MTIESKQASKLCACQETLAPLQSTAAGQRLTVRASQQVQTCCKAFIRHECICDDVGRVQPVDVLNLGQHQLQATKKDDPGRL